MSKSQKAPDQDNFSKNSVHNNEIRCSICLGEEKLVPNCYKCITCSSYFHLDCYNFFSFKETKEEKITKENIDKFECYRCKEEKKNRYGNKMLCV